MIFSKLKEQGKIKLGLDKRFKSRAKESMDLQVKQVLSNLDQALIVEVRN